MDTVKTISAQVERLPLNLQEEVLHFVRNLIMRNRLKAGGKECSRDTEKPCRSILELRGLGKHLWKDTSVKEYINAERDAWDG
jgi:hypothetical protein